MSGGSSDPVVFDAKGRPVVRSGWGARDVAHLLPSVTAMVLAVASTWQGCKNGERIDSHAAEIASGREQLDKNTKTLSQVEASFTTKEQQATAPPSEKGRKQGKQLN